MLNPWSFVVLLSKIQGFYVFCIVNSKMCAFGLGRTILYGLNSVAGVTEQRFSQMELWLEMFFCLSFLVKPHQSAPLLRGTSLRP